MSYFSFLVHILNFRMSGETVLLEHLWGRGPFVCPVRGRRVRGEQIEASTRAVYPGSGRDGRVKPYSCLVVLNWGSRELEELLHRAYGDLNPEMCEPPLRCTRASFYRQRGHRQVST